MNAGKEHRAEKERRAGKEHREGRLEQTMPARLAIPAWWALPALLALTALAYSLHWGFTIDDAAISFSYARNFADGLGLGALYAGAPRVAGYSNFLWVLLLGLGAWAGLDTLLFSKVAGLVFALGAVALLYLGLRQFVRFPWLLVGLVLVPISLTFSFWSVSGLENSLYIFVILAAVVSLIQEDGSERLSGAQRLPWVSAVLLLLVSMTRPEGLVYAAAGLFYKIVQAIVQRQSGGRLKNILVWAGIFLAGYTIFKAWHWWYFGYLWPNPIYAKAGWSETDLQQIWFAPQGWVYLRSYFRTFAAAAMLPATIFGGLVALKGSQRIYPIFALAALALPLYTSDWMVNARFVYPFIAFQAALVVLGADQLAQWLAAPGRALADKQNTHRWQSLALMLLAAWFAYGIARYTWANLRLTQLQLACGYQPMAEAACLQGRMYWTMDEVDQRYTDLRGYADELGLDDPLYLIPDIGATSFVQDLRLLDLAGLANVHLARSREGEIIKQYLLKEQLPDLVKTHGIWTRRTDLTSYSAFKENYLPIEQGQDAKGLNHGTYVRKDLVLNPGFDASDGSLSELAPGLILASIMLPKAIIPGSAIPLDLYWQAEVPQAVVLHLQTNLKSAAGEVVFAGLTPLGYEFLPISEWPEGQVVRQHYQIKPEDVAGLDTGEYTLELSIVDEAGQPVSGGQSTYTRQIFLDSGLAQQQAEEAAAEAVRLAESGQYHAAYDALRLSRATGVSSAVLAEQSHRAEQITQDGLLTEAVAASNSLDDLVEIVKQAATLRGRDAPIPAWRNFALELRRLALTAANNQSWPDAYRLYLAAATANPNDAWAQRGLEHARRQYLLGLSANN